MQIQYFGLSSFKITSKETTAIIDPFGKESGLTPPRGNANLVLLSDADNELYSYTQSLSGDYFVIDGPGEFDVKGFNILGMPVKDGNGNVVTVYKFEVEDIKFLNLAHIKKLDVTQEELEDLTYDVNVLFVPVGNNDVMGYEEAAKAVNLVEPQIVIPMHYKMPSLKVHADGNEKFLKEFGNKFETLDKLTLKKKDLVPETTKVVVLEPLR